MPEETKEDVAKRLDHAAEVFDNKGDTKGAQEAGAAAAAARNSDSPEKAREIEIDFNRGNDIHEIGEDS